MKEENNLKRKRMKGQFFLIAGLLLCIMFFMGLPKPEPLQEPTIEDIKYVYENIERDFSHALTLGLNESAAIDTMKNFTNFTYITLSARYIGFDSLWVISEGNTSTIINVSVGNFLDNEVNVTLTLTRASGTSTIKYVNATKNSANSTEFHTVTSDFNLTIAYNDESKTVEWERDKVNLYALVNLTRRENIRKEEFSL